MPDFNLPVYALNPGMGSTPKGIVYAEQPFGMAKAIHKVGKAMKMVKTAKPVKTKWRSNRKKRS